MMMSLPFPLIDLQRDGQIAEERCTASHESFPAARKARAARPKHHARRLTGRMAAREGDLPEGVRQGGRRLALLRLGWRKRRRPLRQDGA